MLTALALAVPASASAAAFTAHLHAPNHSPIAGKKWAITVTATRGGAKLSGSVNYQFLFGGTVVGGAAGHGFRHGVFHDTLLFPKKSVGYPLTLRVVVKTSYGTVYLPWTVNVRK
jgi:hypothetical protein